MKAAWLKKTTDKNSNLTLNSMVLTVMVEGCPTYYDLPIHPNDYECIKMHLQKEDETKQAGHHEDEDYNVEFIDF